MIFLDTHVVVWLYARLFDKLSPTAEKLINANDLHISPMVRLELQYLYEIDRIREKPAPILDALESELGMRTHHADFQEIIEISCQLDWTRDPFDRIIAAHAQLEKQILLTRDPKILANFDLAQWN